MWLWGNPQQIQRVKFGLGLLIADHMRWRGRVGMKGMSGKCADAMWSQITKLSCCGRFEELENTCWIGSGPGAMWIATGWGARLLCYWIGDFIVQSPPGTTRPPQIEKKIEVDSFSWKMLSVSWRIHASLKSSSIFTLVQPSTSAFFSHVLCMHESSCQPFT